MRGINSHDHQLCLLLFDFTFAPLLAQAYLRGISMPNAQIVTNKTTLFFQLTNYDQNEKSYWTTYTGCHLLQFLLLGRIAMQGKHHCRASRKQ